MYLGSCKTDQTGQDKLDCDHNVATTWNTYSMRVAPCIRPATCSLIANPLERGLHLPPIRLAQRTTTYPYCPPALLRERHAHYEYDWACSSFHRGWDWVQPPRSISVGEFISSATTPWPDPLDPCITYPSLYVLSLMAIGY